MEDLPFFRIELGRFLLQGEKIAANSTPQYPENRGHTSCEKLGQVSILNS